MRVGLLKIFVDVGFREGGEEVEWKRYRVVVDIGSIRTFVIKFVVLVVGGEICY